MTARRDFPWKRVLLAGWVALLFSGVAFPAEPAWKKRRAALQQVHVVDEFRIYYTLRGDDALADVVDANGNGIPDQIDNIALQLTTARSLYTDVLNLRHPLQSPRYRDKARFINVHVGSLPLSPRYRPGAAKGNGSAGDAVVNYHRPSDPEPGIEVLTMDISRALPAQNLTPAHELFHLFQYGYTLFKTGWFLEGTARWVESAMSKGTGRTTDLPSTEVEREKLFAMRYEAAGFWRALARAADLPEEIEPPKTLRNRTYVGSERPVMEDAEFRGATLIKPLLEALDAADDQASAELGLDPLNWPEDRLRSAQHNPRIWSAVVEMAAKMAPRSPEIRAMRKNLPAVAGVNER